MRKLVILVLITWLLALQVNALDYSAPAAPAEVEQYMPEETVSFEKDLWYIIKSALREIAPGLSEAMALCAFVIVVLLLIAMMQGFAGISKNAVIVTGIVAIGIALIRPSKALIAIGIETIQSVSEYNKLLLPVMTGALAAQGGAIASSALYAGTVVLDALLSVMISKVILPLLYAYLALGIASAATEEAILSNLLAFIKWLITWLLKITIYVFTGYMGITGVISGSVDAASLKATKLTISGVVPVVGNIVSDASEAILIGARVIKNSVGIYGMLVILAIWIAPFLKIGIQYLMLKITVGISSLYADKRTVSVVAHITTVMGFILAMLSTVCLLLLFSVICFMKGMNI